HERHRQSDDGQEDHGRIHDFLLASTRRMRTRPSEASIDRIDAAASSDIPRRLPISTGAIGPYSARTSKTSSSSPSHHAAVDSGRAAFAIIGPLSPRNRTAGSGMLPPGVQRVATVVPALGVRAGGRTDGIPSASDGAATG